MGLSDTFTQIAFLTNDTRNIGALKKEVLKLERDLMQQKSRNKVLQLELENPLNVHRWLQATQPHPQVEEARGQGSRNSGAHSED